MEWAGALIYVVTLTLVGLAYLAAGLTAWHRRLSERIGLLLMIVGVAWYLGELTNIDRPLHFTLASMVNGLWGACLAHLALAWPSGSLRSRTSRFVVICTYVETVGGSVVATLFWNSHTGSCGARCPANLIMLDGSSRVYNDTTTISAIANLAITTIVVALIVHEWRSSRGYSRREMTALIWAVLPVATYVDATNIVSGFNLNVPDLFFYGIAPLIQVLPPAAFLVGMVRARLARRAVGTALVELEPGPAPDRLRDTLAAVGDSTLQLAFRQSTGDYHDTTGQLVDATRKGAGRVASALDPAGDAILVYDERLSLEPKLVEVAVNVASLALLHSRLQGEVQAQLDEVRASRARVVEAGDSARRRLERDLHDGAQQRIVTLILALGMAKDRAQDSTPNSDHCSNRPPRRPGKRWLTFGNQLVASTQRC